jgi:glucose/arabinose dehydrogenase
MRRVVSLLLVVLSTAVAVGCVEPRVSGQIAVSGLDHPWDVGFLPNRTMLVTERPGRLSRVVAGRPQLVVAPADVVAQHEAGMLGLAVDPRFAQNGYVFVCMSSRASGVPDVRIVRFQLTQDGARVLARRDVFTGIPYGTGGHVGCRPRFGPDGNLWVGTGDARTGTAPQNPNSLGGKVLRLTRNGAPAPANPEGRPWWTKGHRNVQGIAFRQSDGFPIAVEQGTDRDDEVNVLLRGANYGWDPVPGYNETRPMTDLVKFPGAIRPLWSSGASTIATSGATFLYGPRWGLWSGSLAIGALKGKHLRIVRISADGRLTGTRQVLVNAYGRLRQPVQGPDGNLYVTTDNGGGNDVVVRVRPSLVRD